MNLDKAIAFLLWKLYESEWEIDKEGYRQHPKGTLFYQWLVDEGKLTDEQAAYIAHLI